MWFTKRGTNLNTKNETESVRAKARIFTGKKKQKEKDSNIWERYELCGVCFASIIMHLDIFTKTDLGVLVVRLIVKISLNFNKHSNGSIGNQKTNKPKTETFVCMPNAKQLIFALLTRKRVVYFSFDKMNCFLSIVLDSFFFRCALFFLGTRFFFFVYRLGSYLI